MNFEIVRKGSYISKYKPETIYLFEDKWNDWFQYVTMFQLVYVNAQGNQLDLGSAKFGEFGMGQGQEVPSLPENFETLSDKFYSLGQSEEYYENIKSIEHGEKREEILRALHDIAFDLALFDRCLNEQVTQASLLRHIHESTVREQFHRIATGGAKLTPFDLTYTIPGQKNDTLRLGFHVIPNSFPPTNIHVIVGRNGVGKTHTFQSMIRCLVHGNTNSTYGTFSMESKSKLSNVVCVAFSPFDVYPRQDDLGEDEKFKSKYTYIGLDDPEKDEKRIESLEKQFRAAFEICSIYKEKSMLWTSIISLLNSDPVFQCNGISDLFSSGEGDIENACTVFKRLSSGHKVVLLILTCLIAVTVERTLIILDEPENHLHPPLLSAFIHALSELLIQKNGLAIIATHSPVVLQEVPRTCVQRLSRYNTMLYVGNPSIETYGESIHVLTNEIFGLEVTHSGFHKVLLDLVNSGLEYQEILEKFKFEIGSEARSILRVLIAQRDRGELA